LGAQALAQETALGVSVVLLVPAAIVALLPAALDVLAALDKSRTCTEIAFWAKLSRIYGPSRTLHGQN